MAERFGNVVYWFGCGIAAIIWGCGIYLASLESHHPVALFGVMTAIGAVPIVIGRAVRYILAGN